jgi:hypothetical protein
MSLFWDNICSVLKDVLGYEIPRNGPVMCLGNVPENVRGSGRYLINALLAARRKAITRNWYKVDVPK